MFKLKFSVLTLASSFVFLVAFSEIQAQTTSVFARELRSPVKIIYAKHLRYFLISEAGDTQIPNSGRISIVTNNGDRFTLIDGLPSGPAPPNGDPSGPSALWMHRNKLYIAIGNGNATMAGPAPGSEIPNPNPNSPIFSSVLELSLPFFGFRHAGTSYQLTSADQTRLANGEAVFLRRFGLLRARLRVVADFPDFTPNARPDVPNNVRPSNPFGLALHANTIYIADAAQNNIRTVDLEDGTAGTLITYPARVNPTPVGPPFIDPVPDGLRLFGNKLFVTFLTGFPFPAGQATVRQYDLESDTDSHLIGGLTAAIDILPVDEGDLCNSIYILEFSTNMLARTPGRLRRYEAPNSQPIIIADGLISPTSMARHPESGDLLITEIFPGRITRISLP